MQRSYGGLIMAKKFGKFFTLAVAAGTAAAAAYYYVQNKKKEQALAGAGFDAVSYTHLFYDPFSAGAILSLCLFFCPEALFLHILHSQHQRQPCDARDPRCV